MSTKRKLKRANKNTKSAIKKCGKEETTQKNGKSEECKFSKTKITLIKKNPDKVKVLDIKDKVDGSFETISGYKTKLSKLHVEILDLVGPCSKHSQKTFDSRTNFIEKSNSKGLIEIPSSEFSFFKNGNFYSIADAQILNYQINCSTCSATNGDATILVYPDVELTLNFSVGFEKKLSMPTEGSYKTAEKTSYGKKLEVKKDGDKLSIDIGKIEHIIEKLSESIELVKIAQSMIENLLGPVTTITINFPNFNLEYSCKFSDDKSNFFLANSVYYYSNFKIGLNPLIGVTFEADLVNLLLTTLPAGCGIVKAKEMIDKYIVDKFGKYVEVKLEGKFSLKGSINGNLQFETFTRNGTTKHSEQSQNGLKIEGKIEPSLNFDAHADFDNIFFSIGGGVDLELKGALYAYLQPYVASTGEYFIDMEAGNESFKIAINGYMSAGGPKSKKTDNVSKTTIGSAKSKNKHLLYTTTLISEHKTDKVSFKFPSNKD